MKKLISIILLCAFIFACEKKFTPEEFTSIEPALKSAPHDIIVPDDYPTIQDAVEAAEVGQTILIKEGIYEEYITIEDIDDLTLIGDNALIMPPDDDTPEYADGEATIFIYASNVKISGLSFNGKIENHLEYPHQYPLYAAIFAVHSSLEATKNSITGYHTGITCFNFEYDGHLCELNICHNTISEINGQGINIHGDYDMEVTHNTISTEGDIFNEYFPDWFGIYVMGGNGLISNNKIWYGGDSEYPLWTGGIRLFMKTPGWSDDYNMANMVVEKCHIANTDYGIWVHHNWGEFLEYSIENLRLLYNKFENVAERYRIFNNNVPFIIRDKRKTTNCETAWLNWIPCTEDGEGVEGETLLCISEGKNGQVQQSAKGTYVGLTTGKIYTLSITQNNNHKEWKEGAAFNWKVIKTGSIECEGVVVGNFHMTLRSTRNAKGELVNWVEKGEWWFECF